MILVEALPKTVRALIIFRQVIKKNNKLTIEGKNS